MNRRKPTYTKFHHFYYMVISKKHAIKVNDGYLGLPGIETVPATEAWEGTDNTPIKIISGKDFMCEYHRVRDLFNRQTAFPAVKCPKGSLGEGASTTVEAYKEAVGA